MTELQSATSAPTVTLHARRLAFATAGGVPIVALAVLHTVSWPLVFAFEAVAVVGAYVGQPSWSDYRFVFWFKRAGRALWRGSTGTKMPQDVDGAESWLRTYGDRHDLFVARVLAFAGRRDEASQLLDALPAPTSPDEAFSVALLRQHLSPDAANGRDIASLRDLAEKIEDPAARQVALGWLILHGYSAAIRGDGSPAQARAEMHVFASQTRLRRRDWISYQLFRFAPVVVATVAIVFWWVMITAGLYR